MQVNRIALFAFVHEVQEIVPARAFRVFKALHPVLENLTVADLE